MSNVISPIYIVSDRSPNQNDIPEDGQIWFNRQGSIYLARINPSTDEDAPALIWEQVAGEKGDSGQNGATYTFELENFTASDGTDRSVLKVAGIVESNPTTEQLANVDLYVGANGFVTDREDAVNLRGQSGTGSGDVTTAQLTAVVQMLNSSIDGLSNRVTANETAISNLSGSGVSADDQRKIDDIDETSLTQTEAITDFLAGVINIEAGESFNDLVASNNNSVNVSGIGTIVIGLLSTSDINDVVVTIDSNNYPSAINRWNPVFINGIHQQHNGYFLYFEGADTNTHEARNFGPDNLALTLNYERPEYVYSFMNQAELDLDSIPTIPELKLSESVRLKLNRVLNELSQNQIDKLAQFLATYSTSDSTDIPYLWKIGRATATLADYRSGKIPPQATSTLVSILVSESDASAVTQLTSLQGNAQATQSTVSIDGYNGYTANIPGIGSTSEPTEFSLSGTLRSLSQLTLSDLVKVGIDNLSQAVIDLINRGEVTLPAALQYFASHISFNDIAHQSIATGTGISNLANALSLTRAVALLFNNPTDDDNDAVNEIVGDANTTRITPSNNIMYFFDDDGNPYLEHGHIEITFAENQPRLKATFSAIFSSFPPNPSTAQQENTILFLKTSAGQVIPFIQIRDDNKIYMVRESDSQAFQNQFGDVVISIPQGEDSINVGVSIEIVAKTDGTFRVIPAVKIGDDTPIECNDIDSTRDLSEIDGTFLTLANEFANIKVGKLLAFGNPAISGSPADSYFNHNDEAIILNNADQFAYGLINNDSTPEIDIEVKINAKANLLLENPDNSIKSGLNLSENGSGLVIIKSDNSKAYIGEKRIIRYTLNADSSNRSGTAGTPHNAVLEFNTPVSGGRGISLNNNDSNAVGFTISSDMYKDGEWLVYYWVCLALAVTNTSGGGGERVSPVLYLNASAGANLNGEHGLDAGYLRNTNLNPNFRHWVLKHNFVKNVEDIRSIYPVVRITTQISDSYRIGYEFPEGATAPVAYPYCHVQF